MEESSTKTYPSWHNAIAGGAAGAGSRIATAPLDLIRIRRQLSPRTMYPSESLWDSWRNIVQQEGGFAALYRGNSAAIALWVGYAAVQFAVYNRIRDLCPAFCAGAVAGTCATLATYPFDVCRTTFAARGMITAPATAAGTATAATTPKQPLPLASLCEPDYATLPKTKSKTATTFMTSPPKTIMEFVGQLYKQKGIPGFYAGAGPAVVQIIPYMGLNFAIYDALTAGDRSVFVSAWAGSISGAASKIAIYPLDTVKRRLQAQAFFDEDRAYRGMKDCVTRTYSQEGVASFYRGIVPSVLKTTIATGLSFALFRSTKNALEVLHDSAMDARI